MTTTPDQKRAYYERRDAGYSQEKAATAAGISRGTARSLDGKFRATQASGDTIRSSREQDRLPPARSYRDLSTEAKRAFDDFGYFQRRYFGRIALPFQIDAAEQVVEMLERDTDDWVVMNAPPGVGKTTTFTHDIPAWITVRDRSIRGLLGSAINNTAKSYVLRLRRTFERVTPVKAEQRELAAGRAVDAVATLAGDFGRFRPVEQDLWSAEQFVVMQQGNVSIAEKEPTWSSYGRDGGVLGMRFDFVMWDDLVTPKRMRSQEMIEDDQDWFTDVAEMRLEPGGVFILQGQRFGPNDLFRYALNMRSFPDDVDPDDEALLDEDGHIAGSTPKYTHIKYKAHYEELCEGNHAPSAPAYGQPGGCLIYPSRLRWGRLSALQANKLESFLTVYQQEDVDPQANLVDRAWVDGKDGWPGCWDYDRDRLQLPEGIPPKRLLSVATADPSPSKFWAIEWWLYDPVTEFRYLMDIERRAMEAPDFLDYLVREQRHAGLMNEWQATSRILGVPITTWIVETNAAQKFLLQYDHVHTWQRLNGVRILPHDTHRNKSDPDWGVETLAPHWKFGRIRLPGYNRGKGRALAMKLVDEVTHYPNGTYDDCVMAEWFFEWNLPRLKGRHNRQEQESAPPRNRPDWLREEVSMQRAIAGVGRL